jgi:hypothetical protein
MSSTGTTDNSTAIDCIVTTPCLVGNDDDTRNQQLYIDCMTDLVGTATVTISFDYLERTIVGATVSSAIRGQADTTIDMSSNLALGLNVAATYSFNSGTKLYQFIYSYYDQPYLATNLVTQFTDHGIPGWKLTRYGRIELIPQAPVTLTVQSQDAGSFTYTFLPSSTNLATYDFNPQAAQKGRMFQYQLTSTLPFVFFGSTFRIKKWGTKQFTEVPVFET